MLIAILTTCDDADIIKEHIEHHLNTGVDRYVVIDNDSTDDTLNILTSFRDVVDVIKSPISQENLMHKVCESNPSWVVHLAGDEFCYGLSFVNQLSKSVGLVNIRGKICDHLPEDKIDIKDFHISEMSRFIMTNECCKTIYRPSYRSEFVGKKVDIDEITVHRYQVRSYFQFVNKLKRINESLPVSGLPEIFENWRNYYKLVFEGKFLLHFREMKNAQSIGDPIYDDLELLRLKNYK